MTCPNCGTENDGGQKFCSECGSPLARTCPSCGTPNRATSKFCGECGAALGEAAQQPATPAPDEVVDATERRLVSVLFLDLVSFTSFSEAHDSEDVRSLQTSYFDTARTVIERHGGIVEKFVGDAVMAVWGTPVTHEDDAERAVRAALELVDSVSALEGGGATPLQARAAVVTGEAATSPTAGNQGMVTGDMVNTASRLQSVAEPGQVLVGGSTMRAASRAIVFEPIGELELKGKEEPVRAWRAARVVAERQGAGRVAIEPPFVGRGEELRLLKEVLHATGREGKARVVSVSGIGGIGKSRLVWELEKYVDGLTESIRWHQGRCPPYGEGVTFWALGEMVRMRAGIAETDPPGISRTKLAASVAERVSDDEERRWLEPRLAFLLGLEERPAGGREELFAAWRTFFERMSDEFTVAMIFEDLQWADEGLLDFIESIAEWSRDRPILVITLARPELLDRRPNWGAAQRSFVSLRLEPLSDDAMALLVSGLLPGADDASVARIVERAEGVPLYAVETIRMLADGGVLRVGEDAYELVGDLGALDVPETLQALIASRLDALGLEDRGLLQDAAVLGKSFTLEALSAVSGSDPPSLHARLTELVRKEFLVMDSDPRSPERGQYAFLQDILREVAYSMLSKADRRSRHLATAHHFEAADDEELAGVVATHYVEALKATPPGPDADALAARARDWLGQAAARATSLGSPRQALAFAEQALEITPQGAERVGLLKEAARAAGDALRPDDRIAFLEQAAEAARSEGDANAEVTTMGLLVDALTDASRSTEEVESVVEQMQARLGDGGDELARAYLDHSIALLRYQSGDPDACLVHLDLSLAAFERLGERAAFQSALNEKSYVLAASGRHREAAILLRGTLEVAKEEGDLRSVARSLTQMSLRTDEIRESLDLELEAASVARRAGYGRDEMVGLANAVELAVECGEWATADDLLEDLAEREELPTEASSAIDLSRALLAAYRGDDATARAALDSVDERTGTSVNLSFRAWLHRVAAVVALMRDEVAACYEAAMAAIDEEPGGVNSGIAAWSAGRAALWMGDADKARAALERSTPPLTRVAIAQRRAIEAGALALEGRGHDAAAAYDEILAERLTHGDRFTHAFAALDAAAVLPPDLVPAGALDAASDFLEELGAKPLVARLASGGTLAVDRG